MATATAMVTANLDLALAYDGPVTVFYSNQLTITNLDQLPRGVRAPYLVCLRPHASGGPLIASCWKRRRPVTLQPHEILVMF
jgi:hypothetical protein